MCYKSITYRRNLCTFLKKMSAFQFGERPKNGKNMNYYMKIFNYLIPIWILVSINFCQELSIDLTLLNTGEFTLSSWNNVEELWSLEIKNSGPEKIDYFLKFILRKNNEELVEGHTKPLSINSDEIIIYRNLDPVFDQSILSYYHEASDFTSNIVNQLGYLPPGNYTLELIAVDLDGGATLSSDEEEIIFKVGDQFSIEYPDDGQAIGGESELAFQWSSPGFRQGVYIQYRLIIAAIGSDEIGTPEDAIEYGSNSIYYFDSEWSELPLKDGQLSWPHEENGYSVPLWTTYTYLISQTAMEPLICGYDYAWRMDAREVIDGFATSSGAQGIWGWPEPEKSVIRKFTWGASPIALEYPSG